MDSNMAEINLKSFNKIDPDDLYTYDESADCVTFVYNTTLWTIPCPETHDDLIQEPDCFYDTFPNAKGIVDVSDIEDFLHYDMYRAKERNPKIEEMLTKMGIKSHDFKSKWGSREKAIQFGKAILGRFGVYAGTLVIAFWQPRSHPRFEDCILDPELTKEILKKFRGYPMKDWVVTNANIHDPAISFEDLVDIDELRDKILGKIAEPVKREIKVFKPEYEIDGTKFPFEQLKSFRGKLHAAPLGSKEYELALSILCHPDMDKYPELSGFVPANKCSNKKKDIELKPTITPWQQKGRELYQKNKDTGLLYSPWRAYSEGGFSFRKWLEFREQSHRHH